MAAEPTLVPAALAAILDEVPALVAVMRGDELRIEHANARLSALAEDLSPAGRPAGEVLRTVMDPRSASAYEQALRRVHERREPEHVAGAPVRFAGQSALTYWDIAALPLPDGDGVVLHAVDVTRLVQARRRAELAESRYRTLVDSGAIGVTVSRGPDLLEANDAFLAITGRTRVELEAGLRWTQLTAPEDVDTDRRSLQTLDETGFLAPFEKAYLRPDGARVAVLLGGARLPDGTVLGVCFDVTARRAAEGEAAAALQRETAARRAAERAGGRIARLQEATAALGATNSAAEVGRVLVRHALEEVVASAGLLVRGASADQLVVEHAVGFPAGHVDAWRDFPGTLPAALVFAARTREPVRLADQHALAAACPELLDADLAAGAAVALPLCMRGRILGVLLLAFRAPGLPDDDAMALLRTLTGQAAAALDRAQLYEDRAYVARRLQEGLLPERLPDIRGLDAAVCYRSITGGGEVGGDFYDLFDCGDDRWAVAVGDVCGKGTDAAVVTGLARHTVRAAAQLRDGPAAVLHFLNDALRRGTRTPSFCTVACALLEPAGGGWRVRLSSGGHPFPLLLRAGGRVEEVQLTGTMLGVTDDPQLDEAIVELGRGDALVLYTDGVTDARAPGGQRFGEQRLRRALRLGAGRDATALTDAVEAAVQAHQPGPAADDRAVVVLLAS